MDATPGEQPTFVSANPDQRRATLLILDGARPDVFHDLVAAGDLPNLARYVLEPGCMPAATTVFPSTTGVAYLPFLAGCFPGTCDVPGIRWMDTRQYGGRWLRDWDHLRSYCGIQAGKLNADIRPGLRTLFDIEPSAVAICTPFSRGLQPGAELAVLLRGVLGAQGHYTGRWDLLDVAVGRVLKRAAALARRLVFGVFPAVDGITHWYDPWHPKVLDAYRYFDRAFGDYVRAGGLEGDHLVAVVSDHGATPVKRHTDLSLAFEARGLPTLRHPLVWRRDPSLAVMVSGNSAAHVYLRPGHRRPHRHSLSAMEAGEVPGTPADLVTFIAELEGVALVAATEGPDVIVVSGAGRARLSPRPDGAISYQPDTADVLGLGTAPRELDGDEWLAESIAGPYPDAPVQLLQLFKSRRAGDLVVAARAGADLRLDWEIPEHRSGHGSLVAEHMRCVVALNRRIPEPLRTVDVFPLLLEHLGYEVPEGIDARRHLTAPAPLR